MAEDFNHTDQIIRRKFENFEPEPPLQVWDKVKSGISQGPTSSSGIILPIIVAISILIFLSGLIHHFISDDPARIEAGTTTLNVQAASVISTGSTSETDNGLQEAFYQTPSAVPFPPMTSGQTSVEKQAVIPVRAPFEKSFTKEKKKDARKNKKETLPVTGNSVRAGQLKPGLAQALRSGELSYADAVRYDLSKRDIRKLSGFTDDYARRNRVNWSVGLYFNPEVTNCQDASVENTISYNVGILPGISFNHFFIQSGINLRFTSDKGNLAVDYNRYLGSYEDVYEVTFDSTENGIIPTYHTQSVEVYDTVNHYSISETKANYTYLEIPLLVGYRYTFGRFSLFGKAGPAASFLVVKDVPEAGFPEDKARIVNVNYQIPVRSTVNWQLMMGAGVDYKLADKLNFSLEPTFRFAIKQEYELLNGGKGNTTSFGIRAGLNYNF